jgi:hypothetical protein
MSRIEADQKAESHGTDLLTTFYFIFLSVIQCHVQMIRFPASYSGGHELKFRRTCLFS